jgi:hypothetical protein
VNLKEPLSESLMVRGFTPAIVERKRLYDIDM